LYIKKDNKYKEIKINIPRISIIGIQSWGKSLILKNITRITFLIDEGMCTKCIHEIRIHVENIVVLNILIWEKNEWVEIYPDEIATKLKEYQVNFI